MIQKNTIVKKYSFREVSQDLAIILMSVGFAYLLVDSGVISEWLVGSQGLEAIGPFFAGMFFTSLLTTAPAIVVFGEMAQVFPPLTIAFFGASGAVVGDLVIFSFVKDRFSEHLAALFRTQKPSARMKRLLRFPAMRWLTFLAGGLIIASPLPDEVGIALLGFSKMKLSGFVTVSFVFNFIGILIVCVTAQAIL